MSRGRVVTLIVISAIAATTFATGLRSAVIVVPLLLSVFLMENRTDFESLAKKCTAAGHPAKASASIVGASGVKHGFSFVASRVEGAVEVVSDAALSVADVEETKVLGFYAKVYDVKPKMAILCVSPRLNPAAAELARQYRMVVLENEKPRELVNMLGRTVDGFFGSA